MLQSFYVVKKSIGNAKFYIMGPTDEDDEYYEECVALVEQLEMKDVIFTGSVNIKDYIGKMDILVLTSISEVNKYLLIADALVLIITIISFYFAFAKTNLWRFIRLHAET